MGSMKRVWLLAGRILFWLTWPAVWLYLGRSQRVRVVILCGDELLLNQNWLCNGKWSLPGGGRKGQETALQTARRELHEELGLDIPASSLKSLGGHQLRNSWPSFRYELLITKVGTKPLLQLGFPAITAAQWLRPTKLSVTNTKPEVLPALRELGLIARNPVQ